MKKIEEAASRRYDSFPWDSQRRSFIAGARHVLDAMTSEAAAKAVDRVRILRTSTLEQLAALRKEIEGE